jgi:hypothetical protein
MKEEFLNILKQYLLNFNENIRERIRENIAGNDFEILSNIEKSFLSDKHIDAIIRELKLENIEKEIKNLHSEYYLQLAELYAEGKSNKEIETLLFSDNQTFKKTVKLFPDEATFFKELSIAVDDIKTDKLKKGYAEIDEWLNEKKQNNKSSAAAPIISLRQKIVRYAVAAALLGAIIGGAYLRFFNHNISNDNSLAHNDLANINKPLIASTEIPNLIESRENKASIVIDKTSSGLAGIKESVTVKTNGLSKQIDTLRSILEKEMPQNTAGHSTLSDRINKQIDSLLNILNTYTYDYKNKKVVLNIPKVSVVGNVISINPSNLSQLYLKIEGQYYFIKSTEKPMKLYLVSDKSLIEELKRIEFLNE